MIIYCDVSAYNYIKINSRQLISFHSNAWAAIVNNKIGMATNGVRALLLSGVVGCSVGGSGATVVGRGLSQKL